MQGVGFRPFIFNLASRLGVTGYVANTSQGVTIEAQADSNILDQFVKSIQAQRPRLAQPEITLFYVQIKHCLCYGMELHGPSLFEGPKGLDAIDVVLGIDELVGSMLSSVVLHIH